jgi:pimeloyl-ACP methyl ester carboxylesterase
MDGSMGNVRPRCFRVFTLNNSRTGKLFMQSDTMNFKFGNLNYSHVTSEKDSTLLLLHAFHSSTISYEPLCDLLKDQYDLVCLDFPGHGLSAHVDCHQHAWYYSVEGFTEVLVEFIDRLKLSNYYIAGDSVGGNCAVRAMRSLSGLSGLVLMGTAQARSVEMVFSLHHQTKALELLFQKERSEKEDEIVASAYVNPTLNESKNFKQMMYDIRHTDPNCREFFAKQLETQKWIDELQIIQNTRVPLIYILGEDDGFINSSVYKDVLIESGLMDSQIHLLKNVRHMPQLDDPNATAEIITDFIKP